MLKKLNKLAADQGHSKAQQCVGDCYTRGTGVAQDFTISWQLTRRVVTMRTLRTLRNACIRRQSLVTQANIVILAVVQYTITRA